MSAIQQEIQDKTNRVMVQEGAKVLRNSLSESGTKVDPNMVAVVVGAKEVEDLLMQQGIVVGGALEYKVIIPRDMNKLQAAFNLMSQYEEEEKLRNYNRNYGNFFYNDFAVGMQHMIKRFFGMLHVSNVNTEGVPAKPDYIQIPIRYDNNGKLVTEKGFIGSIKCPCWEECIMDIGVNNLIIRGKLKFDTKINEFLQEVEDYVKANSVVKGNMVTLKEPRPGFLITEPIKPRINHKIVLEEGVERVVNNLIIPTLKKAGKGSLLFVGDFGGGKTETAIRVGIEAREKWGRTFFYMHDCNMFPKLIPYLKTYDHSLCFVEDIDQNTAGDRNTAMNDLLNQLDGNELKNVDCTFLFTTNSEKKIHPAMRRPGRIDQILRFGYCDHTMISKIYKIYADEVGYDDDVLDFAMLATRTLEKNSDLQGAIVAEIAKRALKYAEELHENVLSNDVFMDAIASMDDHIRFMKDEQLKDSTMEQAFGQVFYKAMKSAFPKIENENIEQAFQESPFKA